MYITSLRYQALDDLEISINRKLSKGRFTNSMPRPCRAAKGLERVFPIWFTQCGRVWFTLVMPRPCPAPTMPFFSRPRHRTAVERRPVGDRPAFGFFQLPPATTRSSTKVVISHIPISDVGGECETKQCLLWTRTRVVAAHYKKRHSVKLLD
jgi:hypothetical protein